MYPERTYIDKTAVVALLALTASCANPSGPMGSVESTVLTRGLYTSEQPFEVRIPQGDEIVVDDVFGVTFVGVDQDSRCPTDVVCVWEGDAAVGIGLRMGTGPTSSFTLHTALDPKSVEYAGYRVTLVGVDPFPVSGSSIPQESYRATFRIERP